MKPFNLEHAKAGAPVALQASPTIKVKLYDFEMQVEKNTSVIVGSACHGDGLSTVYTWMQDGEPYYKGGGHPGRLIMMPLGQCGGKDAYYGDTLIWRGKEFTVSSKNNPFSECKWPLPARYYPVTHMGDGELSLSAGPYQLYALVANAAIRHGIDNGYLVDPAELGRLSAALSITEDTPSKLIDMASSKYKKIVEDGNHWVKKCGEANENIAKQNKIITDMAAANAKLIKDLAEAQDKADERGRFLADIAKLVVMGDGYAYSKVPNEVKNMLDAKQDAINERNNILIEIAKGCKLTQEVSAWMWVEVPAAIRRREVAIARHFYAAGHEEGYQQSNKNRPPNSALSAEWVTSELSKVQ